MDGVVLMWALFLVDFLLNYRWGFFRYTTKSLNIGSQHLAIGDYMPNDFAV